MVSMETAEAPNGSWETMGADALLTYWAEVVFSQELPGDVDLGAEKSGKFTYCGKSWYSWQEE